MLFIIIFKPKHQTKIQIKKCMYSYTYNTCMMYDDIHVSCMYIHADNAYSGINDTIIPSTS